MFIQITFEAHTQDANDAAEFIFNEFQILQGELFME